MDNLENIENKNPKSLGRIGYSTAFKNNIQLKNNISSKNRQLNPRTPLKSTINIMNNSNLQPLNKRDNKCLKYPLLKSISSSNINIRNQNSFNNNIINNENNHNEAYNKKALEDEPEDFIHMNENEIHLNNEEENYNFCLKNPKMNVVIMDDIIPFSNYENNNYVLAAHFDDNGKKEYDDYFNSPDENDLNESDN